MSIPLSSPLLWFADISNHQKPAFHSNNRVILKILLFHGIWRIKVDNLCRKSWFSRFPSLTNRFSLILVHGSCRLPISSPDVYSKRNVFDLPCREYGILGPWNYLESWDLSQGKSTRLG